MGFHIRAFIILARLLYHYDRDNNDIDIVFFIKFEGKKIGITIYINFLVTMLL